MSKTIFIGQRLQKFDVPSSMGVVRDTVYIRCYWPKLDQPTALFSDGSNGIEVEGPPTPRNIVFPDDTVFRDYYPDAHYPAELAVQTAFPGERLSIINLTPAMASVYTAEYNRVVATLPDTASVHSTREDCHFLIHKELVSDGTEKPRYEEYIAELDPLAVKSLINGDVNVAELKAEAEFVPIGVSKDKTDIVFKLSADGLEPFTKDGLPAEAVDPVVTSSGE